MKASAADRWELEGLARLDAARSAVDRWELEGLARLDAARSAVDAVLVGHWPADPGIVVGVARLVASAGERLRRAQLCRGRAA